MNTPNPLLPQGSLDRYSKGKSTVRIAIFTIISIHAVFFAGLLMQGCRRDENKPNAKTAESTNQNSLPAIDAGYYAGAQDAVPPVTTNPGPNAANSATTSNPSTTPTATVSEALTQLPPPTTSESVSDGKAYTVTRGDTLTKIAKANGTTVNAIAKANPNVDPAKLKPGQKLQIPAAAPASAASASTPATGIGFKEPGNPDSTAGSGVYTVKAGETLTRIAKRHGTTVKAIRATNNLKTDRLFAGQKLKLPAAHAAHASAEVKTPTVSKMTANNPAHTAPGATTATNTTPQ